MQPPIDQALQLGVQHHHAGRLADAEAIYRRILTKQPNHPFALHYLAMIAHQVGRHEEAREMMCRSLDLMPTAAAFHQNLGLVLLAMGRFQEAVERCRTAIALQPTLASAYNNLGNALRSQRRIDESIEAFKAAIALKPDYVEPITNLGISLEWKDEFTAAIAQYRRAMRVRPGFAGVEANLANVLLLLGRVDDAITLSRQAVASIPNHWPLRSNLLMAFHYQPDLGPGEILRLHREHTAQLDRHTSSAPPHTNDVSPDRRLRVGYVSSDFREHPIAFFIDPILRNHDHEHFEIFCYSDVPLPDAITTRLQPLADHWRPTFGMTDQSFIAQVRQDKIDLLVELSVHTASNRLVALAHKPAPVQLTYLGFCGTTGITGIDYRITDAVVDPPDIDETQIGTERLLRLPGIFCCYQPPEEAPDVSVLPASAGDAHEVTFGVLCTLAKVNPRVIALWSEVLHAAPNFRLLIRARGLSDAEVAAEIAGRFEARGIARDRIDLLGKAPLREYLETFRRVDIELDPFPFSAHTTTCHALWMGVPVITFPGQTPVSRVSESVLRAVGLADLIARSPDEYVRIASELGADLDRLRTLRQGMRDRMRQSALMDGSKLALNLEQQFRRVWRDYCEARPV